MVECEGVTIPWGNSGGVLTIVLAYRPPRAPGSEADNGFSDKFCDLLAGLKSPALVLGDLNYSGIDWERLYASTGAEKLVFWGETLLAKLYKLGRTAKDMDFGW